MIAWVQELQAALDAEFGARPRVATLATVDDGGRPRARTVVCRNIEEDGSLWVASDERSDKISHIRERPAVEIVFWLPSQREQYRVSGWAGTTGDEDARRLSLWSDLSDSARALFFWDLPGAPVVEEPGDSPERVSADAPPPPAFQLVVILPDLVDHLDLKPHPHRRRRREIGDGWEARGINA